MFGRGPFGRGAPTIEAVTGKKLDGVWNTVMVAYDQAGNADPSADRDTETVSLAGIPKPPGAPTGSWADGTLNLTFDLSADDEAA